MNQNADRDYQNFIEAFEVSSFLPFLGILGIMMQSLSFYTFRTPLTIILSRTWDYDEALFDYIFRPLMRLKQIIWTRWLNLKKAKYLIKNNGEVVDW